MTTGKVFSSFQETPLENTPKSGDREVNTGVQPRADALQFAGLLLGAPSPAGIHTILFASASADTPSRRMIHETALALRLIRNSRVAEILLCESQPPSVDLDHMYLLESPLSRDWTATGDASLAMFYWNQKGNSHSSVPAAAFTELSATLQQRFDFILVDAGTVGSSALPILLAPLCSSTVLLVKPGITTMAEVQASQTLLSQAQARLLGFAFVEAA